MKHLIKVRLLGELGRKFAREIELMANTTSDIVKGIDANFPGFRAFIYDKHFKLFKVNPNKKSSVNLSEDMIHDPVGDYNFVICPASGISGSGGVFRIIAGIAIIGLTFFVPFLQPFGFAIGASLILGGVAELMTPKPSTPKEQEKLDSHLFNSSNKTDYYNIPIPLLYGQYIITNPPLLSQSLTTTQLL